MTMNGQCTAELKSKAVLEIIDR